MFTWHGSKKPKATANGGPHLDPRSRFVQWVGVLLVPVQTNEEEDWDEEDPMRGNVPLLTSNIRYPD
ncbi:hypothetical protein NDU88_005636 [Pleurodeles waltl]|uniref:Uncharacterized protein n=1 Tax=Pleurodeles waltl TaxID=8319 RepID=A0AAV7MWX0_PLEWA|nr:hypothetical protein NDU88_005636 [Pleurodeles waltl]